MILSTGGLTLSFNKTTFGVERLSIEGDAEMVSWVRGREFALPTGNNFLAESSYAEGAFSGEFLFFSGLTCSVKVTADKGAAVFHYSFKNDTKKEIVTQKGDLGVYLPFNDDYDDPILSLRRRVHAHVRTQGQAYVYCERYSGEHPSLGLVVTKGESDSYSLERGGRKASRGKILLELPPLRLAPKENYEFEFVLFPCRGREDFFRKAEGYGLLTVKASDLTVFEGEEIVLSSENALCLRTADGDLPFVKGECRFTAKGWGAHLVTVLGETRSATLSYFVLSRDLLEKRIDFLWERQFVSEGEFAGAFTAYDPRSARQVVRKGAHSPFALGGLRAAPLLLMLRAAVKGALSADRSAKLEASVSFYDREFYLGEGELACDIGSRAARKKYDDHPLFAAIKYEEYRRFGDLSSLKESGKLLVKTYRNGTGYEVVPTIPVEAALRREGEIDLADTLRASAVESADRLIRNGNKYAPLKGFPYGPEIVCGALSALLDAYLLTKNEQYLRRAREQYDRLATFCFPSMEYATDDVPKIFRADRTSGLTYDMSPHYTAVYFAVVYDRYYQATGDVRARDLSRRVLRGALTLFGEDGGCRRSKRAVRAVNDLPLEADEQISYGEDVVLYFFDLLFCRE